MEKDVIMRARIWRVALFLANVALVLICACSLPVVVTDSIRMWPWHGTEMLVWPMWATVCTILVLKPLGSVVDEIGDVASRLVNWFSDRRHER